MLIEILVYTMLIWFLPRTMAAVQVSCCPCRQFCEEFRVKVEKFVKSAQPKVKRNSQAGTVDMMMWVKRMYITA